MLIKKLKKKRESLHLKGIALRIFFLYYNKRLFDFIIFCLALGTFTSGHPPPAHFARIGRALVRGGGGRPLPRRAHRVNNTLKWIKVITGFEEA